MSELESEQKPTGNAILLRALLLMCWVVVLAKTYFLLRGHDTPAVIEYSYIVALPTVLWNLKTGLEVLGTWFYIGVLSFIGLGALFWIYRAWRRYLQDDPKTMTLGWNITATILAINFVILIFFVGRELIGSQIVRQKQKLEFEEPPTHPAPPLEPN